MSEEKVPYDPFEAMTGDEFIEALNPKNWKEVQRLHTPTFEAVLQDGGLTLQFPDGQRKQFERSDVEALTRFLNQYADVSPLITPTDDPFEDFEPIKVDIDAPDQELGKAIVSWAKQSYQPISSNDEMGTLEAEGLIPGLRVDLISIEPIDDMWKARLSIAGGRFDIIVTFWLDDIHHLEENRLHIEDVHEAPGTDVPPIEKK